MDEGRKALSWTLPLSWQVQGLMRPVRPPSSITWESPQKPAPRKRNTLLKTLVVTSTAHTLASRRLLCSKILFCSKKDDPTPDARRYAPNSARVTTPINECRLSHQADIRCRGGTRRRLYRDIQQRKARDTTAPYIYSS